jgi:hypothetical protein
LQTGSATDWDLLSKVEARQRLAVISSHYSAARPSRGNIKEVFNFVRVYLANERQL